MKKLLLITAYAAALCGPSLIVTSRAQAGAPTTLCNSANTDCAQVTGGALPVTLSGGGSPSTVNLTQVNTLAPTVPGATNGVQQVGGSVQMAHDTPTVSAAAYTVGQCIGGFRSISVSQFNGQSGAISAIRVLSAAGNTTATYSIILFHSQPSASTCTDNGTFTIAAADFDKVFTNQVLTLGLPVASGYTAPSMGAFAGNGLAGQLAFVPGGASNSGVTTIWYGLIVRSAYTSASTTDLHLLFTIVH